MTALLDCPVDHAVETLDHVGGVDRLADRCQDMPENGVQDWLIKPLPWGFLLLLIDT